MENKEYNEQTLEYEENAQPKFEGFNNLYNYMSTVVVRGFMIYAKSDKDELYDFFYPNTNSRITIKEAENLLSKGHKLLTTERETRYYKIPLNELEAYGHLITSNK